MGTVNGSSWRNYVIPRLQIAYFNPVVADWTEEHLERELYERRHCDFCLYVVTPKQTGFYALAEVVDDSHKRPDRTIYCYLTEDGGDKFSDNDVIMLEEVATRVKENGGYCLQSLDDVIELLNNEQPKKAFESQHDLSTVRDVYISYGRHDSRAVVEQLERTLRDSGYSVWYDSAPIPQEIEFLSDINCHYPQIPLLCVGGFPSLAAFGILPPGAGVCVVAGQAYRFVVERAADA